MGKTSMSIRKYILLASVAPLFSGCATFHETTAAVRKTNSTIKRDLAAQSVLPPVVSKSPADFLIGKPVKTPHVQPAILRQTIHLSTARPLSLAQLAGQVTQISGLPIHISSQTMGYLDGDQQTGFSQLPGLPGQPPITLPALPNLSPNKNQLVINSWNGSLAGLLNLMCARTGTFWRYHNGAVRIFLSETRVFRVAVLPGNTALRSNISNAGSSGASSGSSTGGSGQSGSTTQSASMTSALNIYTDITNNIKTILAQSKSASATGGTSQLQVPTSVAVNQSAGEVIVTATPEELRSVGRYIRQMNRQMAQNVFIDVHIYSVTLSASNNYNLNITAAFNRLGPGISPLKIQSPSVAGIPSSAGELTGGIASGAVSATAVAQALASQGKVSLVTSGSVIALNGQPTPLQVSNQISYLASVTSTQTANVGSSTSLTPGQFTTGFSGSFLPSIRGNDILLEYSINLTQNLGLTSYSSGGSSIQLPNLATQAFMQRVDIRSGQTLILSGFEQDSNQNKHVGTGSAHFWGLGGGATASHSKTALVVVIRVEKMGV